MSLKKIERVVGLNSRNIYFASHIRTPHFNLTDEFDQHESPAMIGSHRPQLIELIHNTFVLERQSLVYKVSWEVAYINGMP
jgi:hypothetical protein